MPVYGGGGDLGGGGGADEKDIGPVYEFDFGGKYLGHQGMPSVDFGGPAGDSLSVGGNPLFAGKGFGGGGFGIMDIGGEFTRSMMTSNPNFTPSLYGLKGESSDYLPGGKYGIQTEDSMPGGGYTQRADTNPEGTEMTVTAMKQEANTPLQGMLEMQMDPSFLDPGGIGSLSPTAPTPFQQETGIFGGTLGPKLRNSLPGKIIRGALQINPGTRGLMMGMALIRGAKNAENPQEFLKGAFKKMALQTAMGKLMGGKGLGLDSMQKALVGTGINMARGKQNMAQGLGSLATSAAFQKLGRPLMKSAYQKGGMPAVYGIMSALKMAQRGAQRGLSKKLAGPPGGG